MALASGTAMNSQTKTVLSMPQSLRTRPAAPAVARTGAREHRPLGLFYHILVAGNPPLEERPGDPDAEDGRNPEQDGVGLDVDVEELEPAEPDAEEDAAIDQGQHRDDAAIADRQERHAHQRDDGGQ